MALTLVHVLPVTELSQSTTLGVPCSPGPYPPASPDTIVPVPVPVAPQRDYPSFALGGSATDP